MKESERLIRIMYWIISIGTFLAVFILLLWLTPPAEASECDHNCKTATSTAVVKEDHDHRKQYAWGAIHTCRLHAVYVGFKEDRWLTWCGERAKPAPLLDAATNDVTPDPQPRIIFK